MGPRMVLTAFDGSTSSCEAIDDLSKAGLPGRGMASVITVAETDAVGDLDEIAHATDLPREIDAIRALPMSPLQRESVEAAAAIAQTGAMRLRHVLPGWHINALVMTAEPADAIIRAAQECYAELVVIGADGGLGPVTGEVLDHAECAVRIGRSRGAFGHAPPRIVIGIERVDQRSDLLQAVVQRAWPAGASFHVVAAEETEPGGSGGRIAAAILAGAGLHASARLAGDDLAGEILRAAGEWGADLILLGNHGGDPGLPRRIATEARCSVELVRPVTIISHGAHP